MLNDPIFISGDSLNEAVARLIRVVMSDEASVGNSRNGGVRFLNDVTIQINNPRDRVLNLHGRKSNIFQLMGESLWVLSRSDVAEGFLEKILPRALQYSDDGKVWHGAYGKRLFAHGQYSDLLETFRREGKDTRRAILMIADPTLDNLNTIEKLYGNRSPKDIPCNRELHFYIVDNKLNLKVIQRSGDCIFGTGSINPFEFTFFQELIYNELLKIFPDLELGVYRWHVTNAHIYQPYWDQAKDVIHLNFDSYDQFIEKDYETQQMNSDIVNAVGYAEATLCYDTNRNIFRKDGKYVINLKPDMDIVGLYSHIVLAYIYSKDAETTLYIPSELSDLDIIVAVVESKFRKFDYEYTMESK